MKLTDRQKILATMRHMFEAGDADDVVGCRFINSVDELVGIIRDSMDVLEASEYPVREQPINESKIDAALLQSPLSE